MNAQSTSQHQHLHLHLGPLARSRQLLIFLDIILESAEPTHPRSEPLYENTTQEPTSAFSPSNCSRNVATAGIGYGARNPFSPPDPFMLPKELQGGIGTISSRRPSFAAESFTRSHDTYSSPLALGFGVPINLPDPNHRPLSNTIGNYIPLCVPQLSNTDQTSNQVQNPHSNQNQINYNRPAHDITNLNEAFAKSFDLHARTNCFHSRRPSQLANAYQNKSSPSPLEYSFRPFGSEGCPSIQAEQPQQYQMSFQQTDQLHCSAPLTHPEVSALLENGLEIRGLSIVALPYLKAMFLSTVPYFHEPAMTAEILRILHDLLKESAISKLVAFIAESNKLTFASKSLCLVVSKNGKMDLLLYSNHANMRLYENDLVYVDGDRGKDMAMVIDPVVSLELAILFNFLKKREHFKSLTISDPHNSSHAPHKFKNGLHPSLISALTTLKSHNNEDNEFVISLPTKQVLRLATPKEVQKLSTKYLEERQAYSTFSTKINDSALNGKLQLVNVEYQADYRKLIFYYFASFQRIDFRGLIKDLFKIYKTRIWLCAVLPFHQPELYELAKNEFNQDRKTVLLSLVVPSPCEYDLTPDQLKHFALPDFKKMPRPNYFHLINMRHLALELQKDVEGYFYGFGDRDLQGDISPTFSGHAVVSGDKPELFPVFNPFQKPNIK